MDKKRAIYVNMDNEAELYKALNILRAELEVTWKDLVLGSIADKIDSSHPKLAKQLREYLIKRV